MSAPLYSRLDVLNPRYIIAACHLAFGAVCLHRPNLELIFRAYATFGEMERWGWGLIALGLVLLLTPRGSLLLMLAQLTSATTLFAIVILLMQGVGPLPTAAMIAVLAFASLILFLRTFAYWLARQYWWLHLLEHPPAWAQRIREGREGGKGG